MPDWQQLVCECLSQLDLDAAERDEVCAELAEHLEDNYRSLLRQGIPEPRATQQVLEQIRDWQDLQRKIESSRKKEQPMNKRVSQFWFPAFLTLFAAMSLLVLIQIFGPNPWVTPNVRGWRFVAPVAVVYLPWLLTLPLIGAVGALLSGRAGASKRTIFASIVFPVLPYLAFFLIGLPVTVILDDHVAHNIMIPAFFVGLAAWVILPAIALLAGGFPVYYFSVRLGTRRVARS